jgi:hypothetical protein
MRPSLAKEERQKSKSQREKTGQTRRAGHTDVADVKHRLLGLLCDTPRTAYIKYTGPNGRIIISDVLRIIRKCLAYFSVCFRGVLQTAI